VVFSLGRRGDRKKEGRGKREKRRGRRGEDKGERTKGKKERRSDFVACSPVLAAGLDSLNFSLCPLSSAIVHTQIRLTGNTSVNQDIIIQAPSSP
jgi:hypothetical protein